jgi:hypothetical protein
MTHKERYNILISNSEIQVIDVLANATLIKTADSESNKNAAITTCTMLNAYWKEIVSLRQVATTK